MTSFSISQSFFPAIYLSRIPGVLSFWFFYFFKELLKLGIVWIVYTCVRVIETVQVFKLRINVDVGNHNCMRVQVWMHCCVDRWYAVCFCPLLPYRVLLMTLWDKEGLSYYQFPDIFLNFFRVHVAEGKLRKIQMLKTRKNHMFVKVCNAFNWYI